MWKSNRLKQVFLQESLRMLGKGGNLALMEPLTSKRNAPDVILGLVRSGKAQLQSENWQNPSIGALIACSLLPICRTRQLFQMDYVVGNKYLVGPKIGNGSSADVFLGTNVQSNEEVALKMESIRMKLPQLKFESKLYQILHGGPGIVNTRWYGVQGQYRVLVMDLLGPSLEDLKSFCSRKFTCSKVELARLSLKTVLMLADQLITVLQYIHSKGFLHRDIKPENFLMGLGRRANQVHIVDYGLAKKWRHPKSQAHIPCREGKKLVGAARFASISNHSGLEQSRRDDLESLGYVLVYLLNGSLPWENVKANTREEKHTKIKKMKMDMCAEVLCEGLPPQFGKFIRTARTLPFEFDPNYEAYKKLFQDCLVEEGFGRDYIYDWTIIHYAIAGVPRTFKGVIPPCSQRCGGTPPPALTYEPPKLGHPDPPRPPPKRVQIPQGRLTKFSPNQSLNNHNLYFE